MNEHDQAIHDAIANHPVYGKLGDGKIAQAIINNLPAIINFIGSLIGGGGFHFPVPTPAPTPAPAPAPTPAP